MSLSALVTGGNRGIGLRVCELLAESKSYQVVFLCARRIAQAQESAQSVNQKYGTAVTVPLELDVTNEESIARAATEVKQRLTDAGLNVLVQNAGVMFQSRLDRESAVATVNTNLKGVLDVWKHFLPILHSTNAVVTHVSSGLGELTDAYAESTKARILNCKEEQEVLQLADEFVSKVVAFEERQHSTPTNFESWSGWRQSSYGVSKALLNALTRVLACKHPNVRVNAVCPGWCRTDMGSERAPRSAEQGAQSVIQALQMPTASFSRDGQAINW